MTSKKWLVIIIGIIISIGAFSILYFEKFNDNAKTSSVDITTSNILVVADIGNTENSFETIKNLEQNESDLIIFPGDLSYTTINDWKNMTKSLDMEKTYIAIGNHEYDYGGKYLEEWAEHYGPCLKCWLDYYELENEYYSFDHKNIHFISLSTETPFLANSQQYKFLKNDLEKTSERGDIDWIIVFFHKPIYSDARQPFVIFRNIMQPIFDQYNVDLVLQGHSHVYERTLPLKFNNTIDDTGQIFITIGTGGINHHPFRTTSDWSIIQNNVDYGFLNLQLIDNGQKIIGKFITNNGTIKDEFQLCTDDIKSECG